MTNVPVQLKSYVGRLFQLKKHKTMFGSPVARSGQKVKYSHTDFGELVLVLDEGTTKVRVQKNDGFPVWIQKFYLLREVVGDGSNKTADLETVLYTIKNLVTKVAGQLNATELKQIEASMSTMKKLIDEKLEAK